MTVITLNGIRRGNGGRVHVPKPPVGLSPVDLSPVDLSPIGDTGDGQPQTGQNRTESPRARECPQSAGGRLAVPLVEAARISTATMAAAERGMRSDDYSSVAYWAAWTVWQLWCAGQAGQAQAGQAGRG